MKYVPDERKEALRIARLVDSAPRGVRMRARAQAWELSGAVLRAQSLNHTGMFRTTSARGACRKYRKRGLGSFMLLTGLLLRTFIYIASIRNQPYYQV